MRNSNDLYGKASRVVVKINDKYSLSIIQGHGCRGDEKTGTVEVGVLSYDQKLIGRPKNYVNGKELAELILWYLDQE